MNQNHKKAQTFQLKKAKIQRKKQEPTSIQQQTTLKLQNENETPTKKIQSKRKKKKKDVTSEGSFESQAFQIHHPWRDERSNNPFGNEIESKQQRA